MVPIAAARGSKSLNHPFESVLDQPLLRSKASREGATRLLRALSPGFLPALGFERELRSDQNQTAVCLGFTARDPGHLSDFASPGAWRTELRSPEAMARLDRFAGQWSRDSKLNSDLQHVWLEYDPGTDTTSLDDPGVFLGRMTPLPSGGASLEWLRARFDDLETIFGTAVPNATRLKAERLVARIPPPGTVASVGYFRTRSRSAVRICALGLDAMLVSHWVEPLVPGGVTGELLEALDDIEGHTEECLGLGMVHVDVGVPGDLKLGVELVFEFNRQLARRQLPSELLAHLVRRGAIDATVVEDLTRWPGCFYTSGTSRRLCVRRVNHLKIVLRPDGIERVKAYFGVLRLPTQFLASLCRCAVIDMLKHRVDPPPGLPRSKDPKLA